MGNWIVQRLAVSPIDWLANTLKILIRRREHVIADRRIAWIHMGKRIPVEPFHHDGGWLKDSVALNPAQKLRVNVEVLVGVSQHDDSRLRVAAGNWNPHNVAERDRGAIVIGHRVRGLTRIRQKNSV